MKNKVTILNSSILTNFGEYEYTEISTEEARELIAGGFESAIGHQSACDVLETLLSTEVKMNRIQYAQGVGDTALVFKLNGRPPEGKILSVDEIKEIGFHFGKLERKS